MSSFLNEPSTPKRSPALRRAPGPPRLLHPALALGGERGSVRLWQHRGTRPTTPEQGASDGGQVTRRQIWMGNRGRLASRAAASLLANSSRRSTHRQGAEATEQGYEGGIGWEVGALAIGAAAFALQEQHTSTHRARGEAADRLKEALDGKQAAASALQQQRTSNTQGNGRGGRGQVKGGIGWEIGGVGQQAWQRPFCNSSTRQPTGKGARQRKKQ
ncbi:Protein of unknown function [Gryllus bimaculatus]|nr:Protein of unknown function [Gryllus bimaculatus]